MDSTVIDMSSHIGHEPTTPAQHQAAKEAQDPATKACAKCNKTQSELSIPLKRCAKCQSESYCSRGCQVADWKAHKKSCAATQQNKPEATTNFDAMPKEAGDFFEDLAPDNYLHKFPEKEAYTQLIDCYRMRVEDDYKFAGDPRGLYNEEAPLPDFKEFLDLAEKRMGLLPKWWKQEKRMACERLAVDSTQWSDINSAVEKADVIKHYGDNVMPMKLRLLAEKVYGKKIDMGYGS